MELDIYWSVLATVPSIELGIYISHYWQCSYHGAKYILVSIGHCSQYGARYIPASISHCIQSGARYIQLNIGHCIGQVLTTVSSVELAIYWPVLATFPSVELDI